MSHARPLVLSLALVLGCTSAPMDGADAGAPPIDDARVRPSDVGTDPAAEDAGGVDGGVSVDMAAPDPGTCAAGPFRPMIGYDGAGESVGAEFYSWRRSAVDDSRSVSQGRSVRVSTNPGDELLPACSGGHFFAGRSPLPALVPQGRTIWFRVYQYIPSTFSFGYKYSRGAGDSDAARACGQYADGNASVKWLVLAPAAEFGTARIYLLPSATRRSLASDEPRVRVISEALHSAHDEPVNLPRDRWFALQMAVRVSDGDDGFIRAWIDDRYLGEVTGRTTVEDAALASWGMGDYWNGVPWTDGEPGRTDFWIDEVIVASDADGYDPPTGVDSGGRPYIAPCTRVADLMP